MPIISFRINLMSIRKIYAPILLLGLLLLEGCNPFFVARMAYEESKILLNREKIESVIQSESSSEAEKRKLSLVLEARRFGEQAVGLTPRQSFTRYTRLDREVLAWVLVASRPDSFSLYSWWYPVVGSVPYKGYFEKSDAESAGAGLEKKGYETWVRPTEAFSTLGWFNDPVLSTTLANDEVSITNTVLHESLHSTVWIPNYVDFNESLANFVGHTANISFYEQKLKQCEDQNCKTSAQKLLSDASAAKERALAISHLITDLYQELDRLYKSDKSTEQKLKEREVIFEKYIAPVRAKNPKMKAFAKINNAEIMQLKLYMTDLSSFEDRFKKGSQNWREFLAQMNVIKSEIEKDSNKNPWDLLHNPG